MVGKARAIPTSRAYWDLRAEQVLNRVFEPEQPIVVEVCDTPANGLAQGVEPSSSLLAGGWINRLGRDPSLLLAAAGISLMVLAGVAVVLMGAWNYSQQAIREERNLLLMERLRSMGPSSPAAITDPAAPNAKSTAQGGTLPPPPPGEPWIEELASLPASTAPTADVLQVPLNNRIGSPAPAASGTPSTGGAGLNQGGGNAPQLVGVVQVPGQSGSAIFQTGGSSTSAAVGENIGSSGWRLLSASGDSAILERGGQQRRVSISSGF